MKAIIQEDITGCAIASASVLSNQSYQQTKVVFESMGLELTDAALWSSTEPMRALCQQLGIELDKSQHGFTGFEDLPDKALLAIKWKQPQQTAYWHWVVFARLNGRAFIFDSKKGLKHNMRTDFGRIKPKWFIPVLN